MNVFKILGCAALFMTFASPAAAQKPVSEILEDVNGNQCVAALKTCRSDGIGAAWREARTACADLRSCKTDCRADKRSAKSDNRQTKKACVASCGSKSGKAKRQCKKACRKTKRAANKQARKGKRNCKNECRAEYKTPECKGARGKVSKALMSCAAKAGAQCADEVQKLAN